MSFVLFLGIISVMNRNSLNQIVKLSDLWATAEPSTPLYPVFPQYFVLCLSVSYGPCLYWKMEKRIQTHTLISRKNSRTDSQVINLHRLPLCKFLCAKCRSKLLVTCQVVSGSLWYRQLIRGDILLNQMVMPKRHEIHQWFIYSEHLFHTRASLGLNQLLCW